MTNTSSPVYSLEAWACRMPAHGALDARSSARIMMEEEMAPASFLEKNKSFSVLSGKEILAVQRPCCLVE